MAAFVPVAASADVPDGITEVHSILQMLHWCGFDGLTQRTAIFNDSISTFDDIKMMSPEDITAMQRDFGNRAAVGRIHFGVRRTKKLTSMLHFVQDFYRVSETPTIVGLNDNTFAAALETALTRADVCTALINQSDISAKQASPGPLMNKRSWKEWETKFDNYLSTIIGLNSVPISHVIRLNNDPPADQSSFTNFTSRTIACVPLSGVHYEADRYSVFQQLLSFTTGHPSEDWIKSTRRYADGRRSMKALRDHFLGEGNVTKSIEKYSLT